MQRSGEMRVDFGSSEIAWQPCRSSLAFLWDFWKKGLFFRFLGFKGWSGDVIISLRLDDCNGSEYK
jgi:hypothetical protein